MFNIGFLFFKNERFAHSLFLMSDVNESLMSFTKNEQMSESLVFERIALSLIFSQKTSDLLRKPMSEFPALIRYRGGNSYPLRDY